MNSEHRSHESQASWTSDRPGIRVIRMRQLSALLSVSRSTLYDWLNPHSPRHDPSFPRPVRLSAKGVAVGWIFDDVKQWLNSRM